MKQKPSGNEMGNKDQNYVKFESVTENGIHTWDPVSQKLKIEVFVVWYLQG